MGRIETLAAEITGDPLTRGYSGMTDAQVAADVNTVYRPADVSIATILKFLILDNVHSTDGSDTQDRSIWQRMKEVVALAETPTTGVADPWGSTTIGNISEIQQIKCHQLVDWIELSAQGNLPVDVSDTNWQSYVSGAQAAGCMSSSQETALNGLGDNLQSRGQELGIGRVGAGTVAEARAL